MSKVDPKLGHQVKEYLITRELETQLLPAQAQAAHKSLKEGVRGFLIGMGLDIEGDLSIVNTPSRVADMFVGELCYGLDYNNFPKCTTSPTMGTDEMVLVDSIQTVSLCEHHFQTITGVTHIAYIPGKELLGLSKFARVTNFFARRPQVQERMTEQIHAALEFILGTDDIAVMQVATHNCMRARGAMDPTSKTTTSKLGGRFMTNPALRAEFMQAIPRNTQP